MLDIISSQLLPAPKVTLLLNKWKTSDIKSILWHCTWGPHLNEESLCVPKAEGVAETANLCRTLHQPSMCQKWSNWALSPCPQVGMPALLLGLRKLFLHAGGGENLNVWSPVALATDNTWSRQDADLQDLCMYRPYVEGRHSLAQSSLNHPTENTVQISVPSMFIPCWVKHLTSWAECDPCNLKMGSGAVQEGPAWLWRAAERGILC